jgi:filamentous hemagglutinin
MNRDRHRLKFCHQTGLWVPVAECARGRGKRGRSTLRRTALAVSLALTFAAQAADSLPVAAQQFVARGAASMATQGAAMTITQHSSSPVLLQWNSFNIGKGHSVHFDQASSAMRAVNVVMPGGPRSDINGALTAKGQVLLFNQAGILFGESARVDVGGLVASTLKLNDKLIESALNSLGSTEEAFSLFADGDYAGRATGDVSVARGARIIAAKNGRVLLAAPDVNVGTDDTLDPHITSEQRAKLGDAHISAEEGQVILAAGEKVYVADPLDSRLRGFLVEVNNGGKVTTEAASELLSERGNITLVGLNIRHGGAARTTTSVTLNGTVFLKARDGVTALTSDDMFPDAEPLASGETIMVATNTGRIELAAGSSIEVTPDTDTADQTLRDDVLFRRSEVNLYGREVIVEDADSAASGASIHAPSGLLRVTSGYGSTGVPGTGALARTYIGRHADIDLSGVKAAADADRETVRVELRGTETAGSPLLRDPAFGRALFGEEIWVDTRVGTQLVDISGYLGSIERTVSEKSASGGDLVLTSPGTVLTHTDSRIDLSGGTVTYGAGQVAYSLLTSSDGRLQTAENARADRLYTGTTDRTRTVAAIVEGRDAGSISIDANSAAIDGRIDASRTVGVTQREAGNRWVGPGVNQRIDAPQAGTFSLSLNRSSELQNLTFVRTAPSRQLTADVAAPSEILIRADLFSRGVSRFVVEGAGRVSLPEKVELNADAGTAGGSRIAIEGTAFDIDGIVTAAGGEVSFSTSATDSSVTADERNVRFGKDARISVAGRWVDDTRTRTRGDLSIDAGSVSVDADGDLTLAEGAQIDASAGAWRRQDGSFALGDAGSVSLLAGSVIGNGSGVSGTIGEYYGTLSLDGSIAAYGVTRGTNAGGSGSLALRSASIVIDGRDTGLDDGVLALGQDLFSKYGFSDFKVEGGNGVELGHADASSFALLPSVQMRRLDALPQVGATTLNGSGSLVAVERARRSTPISLAFNALSNLSGRVELHKGAQIGVDAGGSISMTGNRSIVVAGKLTAPGGTITLDQEEVGAGTNIDSVDFGDIYHGASIFLEPTAVLDVSGTFLRKPDVPYADGIVYAGGDITLAARRGYLVAQDNVRLIANGSSALLDQPVGTSRQQVRVDSAGGNIVLNAREGLYAEPLIMARAGGTGATGGAVTVELVQGGNVWQDQGSLPGVGNPRELEIVQDSPTGAAGFAPDTAPDAALHAGHGVFAAKRLTNSGVTDLTLRAVDRNRYGALVFTEDLAVAVDGTVLLDSANLIGRNGADARLAGSALEWRNTGRAQQNHAQPTSMASGDGSLLLSGDLVSVSGNLAASGFSAVTLEASGDLRASAADSYFEQGSTLTTSGDLTLSAAQVYPTTASKFAFEIQNNAAGTLVVRKSGRAPGLVYSALGELTLAAPNLVQDGRVVAPLGQIRLLSQSVSRNSGIMASATRSSTPDGHVELAAGSVTSVSADGLLVPLGQTTLSGVEWIYTTGTGDFVNIDGTPQKAVTVNGASVSIAGATSDEAAARVDLSGGGDIQAWEWIPGSGGSADILSGASAEDAYAIVPTLGNAPAPFDTSMQAEDPNSLRTGQSISILADANGLKAGTYTLLPARYALLPGAYLVRLSRDDQSLAAGRATSLVDGTARVSVRDARVTSRGTASGGKAFVAHLLTQEQVRQRAEYLLSSSSDVFNDNRSTADAGRLSIQVGQSLQLAGVLDTAHAASARGAQVDLTARALALLGEGARARDGEVGVSVAALNALDAESLVLGGSRGGVDEDTGATLLETKDTGADGLPLYGAASVRLDNSAGPALQAPDVVLVARDHVVLETGSAIAADGEAAKPELLQIEGAGADADGALLRVSVADVQPPLRDAPAGARGTLTLGEGARLQGMSVILDSTLSTENRGVKVELPASGGALALTGSSISVGAVPQGTAGLVFDSAALAALGSPDRLTLKSYGSLDLYGDVTLGSEQLSLLRIDTAGIVGHDNSGITQRIAAAEVQLANSSPTSTPLTADAGSSGTLLVDADELRLDGGSDFAVRGFDTVRLEAGQRTVLGGKGRYDIAAADVAIATPRVAAAAGANVAIQVTGALTLYGQGGVQAKDSAVGGILNASAREIGLHTLLDLPSGNVSLTSTGADAASGSVVIGTLRDDAGDVTGNARILLAGTEKDYLGKKVATPGGTLTVSALTGDVRLEQGAVVDVSAAGDGRAGSVSLSAPGGDLQLADEVLRAVSAGGESGGSLSVDVREMAALDVLVAASGDFTRRWEARVRQGDTRLDGDLQARDIAISADAGSVVVAGTLDASGAAQGGRIEISARRAAGFVAGDASGAGDVLLAASSVLDARATSAVETAFGTQGEGGTVLVSAAPADAAGNAGTLRIADGARIEAGVADGSAARAGVVTLRAARVGTGNIAVSGNVADAVSGAREVFVEGSRVHELAAGATVNLSQAHVAATEFMESSNVDAMRAALGLPMVSDGLHHIRPHIELRSAGDLAINATDLSTLTYLGGTEAGALSVRAGGTLRVNGTLSDGFGRAVTGAVTNLLGALTSAGLANTTHFRLGERDTAWSIQLASGSDTTAARAASLQTLAALEAADSGDLVIAANAQVRTGAGEIEVSAGRDLRLSGARSAIYSAGYQDARGTPFDASTQLNINASGNRRAEYAQNGGDVTIVAQRDISAAQSNQTLGGWMFRQGRLDSDGNIAEGSAGNLRNPTWYARIDQFDNGVATFGGGDVVVRAGGDIDNLTVATASNARLFGDGGTAPDAANLKVLGGGDITVTAGGNIGSASFLVDRGVLAASAGGDFDSARNDGAGSVLALGDAKASLQATGDIDLETIASATLVQQIAASRASSRETYFVGYGADNSVDVSSFGGSVTLSNSTRPWGSQNMLLRTAVLPGSLSLVAMAGDLAVGGDMVLMPSVRNDVLLAAAGNIDLRQTDSGSGVQIRIADSAPERVPSLLAPALNDNNVDYAALVNFNLVTGRAAHDEQLNAAREVVPVRIVAERGNIDVPFNDADLKLTLYSPQPVLIEAGGNVTNLALRAQHYAADDLTRIRAGGDIAFDAIVDNAGQPVNGVREGIQVGGRGKLEVIAGGNIDLANSIGVVTRGNFDNPALPEAGASILLQSGADSFDADALISLLRDESTALQDALQTKLDLLEKRIDGELAKALPNAASIQLDTSSLRNTRNSIDAFDRAFAELESALATRAQVPPASGQSGFNAFMSLPESERSDFYRANRPLLSSLMNATLRLAGIASEFGLGYSAVSAAFGDQIAAAGQSSSSPADLPIDIALESIAQGYKSATPAMKALLSDYFVATEQRRGGSDINLFASQVKSEQGGNIDLFAPLGAINVGVAGAGASSQSASRQGVFTIGSGEINALSGKDFQVGPSRVMTLGGSSGSIQIWSSFGDIDAGRGSSTAAATPPPQVVIRGDLVVLDVSASVSGSGVRILQKSPDIDISSSQIRVFAPNGFVIAEDAGFEAEDIPPPPRTKGDQIPKPPDTSDPPPPAAPPSSESDKVATNAGTNQVSKADEKGASERNSILTVELVGLGEESTASGCDKGDEDERCKERAKRAN